MSNRWACCRLLLVLALVLLGSGCALNRQLAREADGVVERQRPTALTCDRADRCAIATPYRRLADEARAASRPDAPVHYVNVLERGEDALLLRLHLIRAARRSIDVQTFIWADDDSGWLILDELIAAARRGVRVRVLADQLFSISDVDWFARLARAHANFEFRLYNVTFHKAQASGIDLALSAACCFSRLNQRMHNKLLLVDGEFGIAGGRNYQDRYFDWDQTFDYRDRDVLVFGPQAGQEMVTSFEQFWTHPLSVPLTRLNDVNRRLVGGGSEGPLPPPATIRWARVGSLRDRATDQGFIDAAFASRAHRVGRAEYFSDPPGKNADSEQAAQLSGRIAALLRNAHEDVLAQTPYLVFSRGAQDLLQELRERDPPLHAVVSTNSLAATDAFYVYAISYKHKKKYLKRLGLRVFEFKPFPGDAAQMIANYHELSGGGQTGRVSRQGQTPLKQAHGVRLGLHAKSIVIDRRVTMIGSHNFDPRSDYYNTESGFIIHDRAVAREVSAQIERDIEPQNSWTIARRPLTNAVARINNAMSTISAALPIFDLWPFRYATSYELNPGCEPLWPNDPGFYACYTSVGDFPEVDLPLKTIYTRIITAFGVALEGVL
ncbi:phospholipase D family protein [Dokdonella koreensis]|uniref:Phosphatidylserine/phosphatidylglycerophosphate/ cardiolipin synthase n=1 Tax=Dokdonella koreensis DS-123 TaxID=1300342 RepID=A0A167G5A3_9GAMM|nr:phospholipase D family protein [Dokdonella koreensis]ANB16172.1 Phosphatidylserine/phosphatidylglycerophosphate/ cardiolipin synthase [Dokdonella koreensis DS-123]